MTIEELRVVITAKTDKLQEGINKATSRLKGFKNTTDNTVSASSKNIEKMKSQYDALIKKLDIVNAQAELQQRKLNDLRAKSSRMDVLGQDSPKAMKLQEQILRAEARMQNLIATSDKTANKITELEEKMNSSGIATEKTSSRFQNLRDGLDQIKEKFRQTGNEAKRTTGQVSGFANMLNRTLMRVLKRIFIYNLIYRAIRGIINYMGSALKTNNEFSKSLNTIKTNLRVAFQPIFDFILPATNALMKGLATITTYIASFTSALFGKTYKQSYEAAKGIDTAKKSMEGYGKATKGALASFDEINQLNTNDEAGASGFEMSMPEEIPETKFEWLDRLKNKINETLEKIDWSRINNSLNQLKESVKPFATNVGEGLLWFLENVLIPLGVWHWNELVPRFLEILAKILAILNKVLEALKPYAKWLLEEFLQPLAKWTGEKILKALDWLNEKLKKLGDWINENPDKFQKFVGVVTALGVAIGILTSPIGTVGLALAGLGLALIKLWKENETFRDNVKAIWEQVKEIISLALEFIKSIIVGVFNGIKTFWEAHGEEIKNITRAIWEFIGDIINSALTIVRGILDVFIGLFTGDWQRMVDGLKEIWQGLWNAIKIIVSGAWSLLSGAFSSLYNSISSWFSNLAKDALNWGKNMISNLIDGIKSMVGKVKDTVKNVAKTVSDFLGFSSPTKEGPGKYADKWMPNMMNMLAEGIEDNMYKIKGAVNVTANTLGGVQRPDNTSSIVNAISSALSGRDGDMTVIVKIGEDTITEKLVRNINRQSRISGKTVIQV